MRTHSKPASHLQALHRKVKLSQSSPTLGGGGELKSNSRILSARGSSVSENCVLKLSQINEKFRRRLPAKPLIHDRTVARNLEGMMFRVELVRPVPAGRNRRDVLQRRQECENWFMNHAIIRHYVFIDECGYNRQSAH